MQHHRSTSLLNYIGILSIVLSILIVPSAMPDPVLSGFIAWLAVALGGLSNIGINSKKIYPCVCVLISMVSITWLNINTKTGIEKINATKITEIFLIMAIPLIFCVFFMAIGFYRRKKAKSS